MYHMLRFITKNLSRQTAIIHFVENVFVPLYLTKNGVHYVEKS
eukprot:UN32986